MNKGRNLAVPDVYPRPKQIRDRSSVNVCIRRVYRPVTPRLSQDTEPSVHVVSELAVPAVAIEYLRRWLPVRAGGATVAANNTTVRDFLISIRLLGIKVR